MDSSGRQLILATYLSGDTINAPNYKTIGYLHQREREQKVTNRKNRNQQNLGDVHKKGRTAEYLIRSYIMNKDNTILEAGNTF